MRAGRAWLAEEGFGVSGMWHNASQNKSLQNAFPIYECQMETPLQDTVRTLLLQKLVHGSIFFAWIIHESEDGTKHVFTLLVVEMVRGILRWHVRRDVMRWEELRHEDDEARRAQMRWDEMKCGVWSAKRGLRRAQCEVWRKGSLGVRCKVIARRSCSWTQQVRTARTHGLGWRAAHASSIDKKGLVV